MPRCCSVRLACRGGSVPRLATRRPPGSGRTSQRWEPDYMILRGRRPSGQCRPKVDADENGQKNEAGSYGHISSPYVVAGVNDTASERRPIATVRSHRRGTCREVESLLLLCSHDFSSSESPWVRVASSAQSRRKTNL